MKNKNSKTEQQNKIYSLEKARTYWSYPPCKTLGKKHTKEHAEKPNSFIKKLIEDEIRLRDEVEGTGTSREIIADLIKNKGMKKVLDFGCGLGQEGLYFAKECGVEVTFADISPSNIELTKRFPRIWNVNTKSSYIDNPLTISFPEKFDLIMAIGVLHHTPQAKLIAANLRQFLNEDGFLILMLYTKHHYARRKVKTLADYALKSEALPPAKIVNPYSDYYDVEKVKKVFEGYEIERNFTTNKETFGWYFLKKIERRYEKSIPVSDIYSSCIVR